MLLHGIFPPITTPFYPDGRVYLKKLEHNVDRYSKTPVAGIVELAAHPNIIGIKESGGEIEKIRRMAAATRHVKRSATVTETFAAVTPRMLKSGQRQARDTHPEAQLISVGALIGERSPSAAETATSLGSLSTRLEAVPSQSSAGNSTMATPGSTSSSSSAVTFADGLKTRQKEVGFQILAGAAQKLHPSLEAGAV